MVTRTHRMKAALLAAASLTAAGMATHAVASAADVPAVSVGHVAASPGYADDAVEPAKASKRLLAVIAAGVLAAIIKLFGFKRVWRAVRAARPVVEKAARIVAQAPIRAVQAVGASMASPLRFALLMASLGLVAFLGIGFFDVEWAAGLAVGAAMTALTWFAAEKIRRKTAPRRAVALSERPFNRDADGRTAK